MDDDEELGELLVRTFNRRPAAVARRTAASPAASPGPRARPLEHRPRRRSDGRRLARPPILWPR